MRLSVRASIASLYLAATAPAQGTHAPYLVTFFDAENPVVAYASGSDNFLIAWNCDPNPANPFHVQEIVCRLYDGDATTLLSTTLQLTSVGGVLSYLQGAIDPSVAYCASNDTFVLTYTHNPSILLGNEGWAMQAFRADDMTPIGSPVGFTAPSGISAPGWRAFTQAVYNPATDEVVVAVVSTPTASNPRQILVYRFAAQGLAAIGSPIAVSSPAPEYTEPHLAYDPVGGGYLVAWNVNGGAPLARFLDPTGFPLGTGPFSVPTGSYSLAWLDSLIYDPVNAGFVVTGLDGGISVVGRVDTTGTSTLSMGFPDFSRRHAAFSPAVGEVVISERGNSGSMFASRLVGNSLIEGGRSIATTATASPGWAAVAASSTASLIAWQSGTGLDAHPLPLMPTASGATPRNGTSSFANPEVLHPTTPPPSPGAIWQASIDHSSFVTDAVVDLLLFGNAISVWVPPYGYAVCDATLFHIATPGATFDILFPASTNLLGASIVTQGMSVGTNIKLTNGFELTLGNF